MSINGLYQTQNSQLVLSIIIVTRNRKGELLRALKSSIEFSLPAHTEFVIVDNASQDCTKEAVDCFFQTKSFEYQYFYSSENLGPAAGRNKGMAKARGRYIYFMDDDIYLDSPKSFFFEKMISVLEENNDVFCITTWIYDTSFNDSRPAIKSKKLNQNGYKKVLWFHGGSFFVDRQRLINQNQLFLNHHFWGMEELYPSLKGYFGNRYIVEVKDLIVIHDPSVNTRLARRKEIILHYTGATHVKTIFYPLITYPFVYFVFCLRIIKHLGLPSLYEACLQLSRRNKNLQKETISLKMFYKLIRDFGLMATL